MKRRCLNPDRDDYYLYGGRGIKVCERWMLFDNFVTDMGQRPDGKTLDRIDTNGNYEPGNCKWSTVKQQNRNTRATKLTEDDVDTIRQMSLDGFTQKEIKDHYSISQQMISRILLNEAWRP